MLQAVQVEAQAQQQGLARLVPRKRGLKKAHKLRAEVLDFIRETRLQDPSLPTADLVGLIREHFNLTVHPRTIERGLARSQKKRQREE
jgi:hypothetical protein